MFKVIYITRSSPVVTHVSTHFEYTYWHPRIAKWTPCVVAVVSDDMKPFTEAKKYERRLRKLTETLGVIR